MRAALARGTVRRRGSGGGYSETTGFEPARGLHPRALPFGRRPQSATLPRLKARFSAVDRNIQVSWIPAYAGMTLVLKTYRRSLKNPRKSSAASSSPMPE